MKSLKLRVRKTMFVFIAATGVFVLLFAQCRTHSQALMSARAENLTGPLLGLTTAQRAAFDAGLAEFQAVETIAEGLGPVFNGKSCAECHALCRAWGGRSPIWAWRVRRVSAGCSTGSSTRSMARYPSIEAADCCNSAPSTSRAVT